LCPRQDRPWIDPRIYPEGDHGLVLRVDDEPSPEANRILRRLTLAIESEIDGILDVVPSYVSLLVVYDPLSWDFHELADRVKRCLAGPQDHDLPTPRVFDIPTVYGGEYGPDLERVCEYSGLAAEDVVSLHSGRPYLIYFIGFSPGYPYLGGLPPALATPRLETPRTRIPPGSVGIGGRQAGIYPQATPGGWNLIGRTPAVLYDHRR